MSKKSTAFRQTSFPSQPSWGLTPMVYLCRFRQRNRLIKVPLTSEYYRQQDGISHDNLKCLIIEEFQLQHVPRAALIIQIWNEQYQEYIDIESYKRIPFEARLQILIEKDVIETEDSLPFISKTQTVAASTMAHLPVQLTADISLTSSLANSTTSSNDENDSASSQMNVKVERIYSESIHNTSSVHQLDTLTHSQNSLMYDLLPKPSNGIPIPRFPPHIVAFLNGSGDANQLNALVQALYQEIVKYELYPNADELRSIVSRLVDRHPQCLSVIGSIELLSRKLYYKFCNERKKYPIELKRRQPNKRQRILRVDDLSIINNQQISLGCQANVSNELHNCSLDRLMNLWTTTVTNNYKDLSQQYLPQSGSSSNSSSPISNNIEPIDELEKLHPINLSMSTNNSNSNNSNLVCME